MKERQTNIDTLRTISALGAGVLLAATPHCGGQSQGTENGAGSAGDETSSGGYSGVAGTVGTGGTVGLGGSGGYGGTVGNAGFGGTVGLPGTGGTCSMPYQQRCWEPSELLGCGIIDSGPDVIVVDGGDDTGTGEGGQAGAAAEAPPEPWDREPDGGIYVREASTGAVSPPPEGFTCPTDPPFPQCVMSDEPPPAGVAFTPTGWNGSACCYAFYYPCR